MILWLHGRSYSGKTTLADRLALHFNFKVLQVYTNRPKRYTIEPDRVCISDEQFQKYIKEKKFAVHYKWVDGKYYGILKTDLEKTKKGIWITNLIYNPDEINPKLGATVLHLHTTEEILRARYAMDKRYPQELFELRLNEPNEYQDVLDKLKLKIDTSTPVDQTFGRLCRLLVENDIIKKEDLPVL